MKSVFVSSTIWDLADVRAEIREFLARNGFQPIMSEYEDFPDDLSQTGTYEKCRQAVVDCDIFLMIVNNRYGGRRDLKEGEVSITHQEFKWAVELRKPFVGLIRDKLETDRQIWKNSHDEKVLTFVKGAKNLLLFDLLDEIDRSATDGTALWRQTFKDSVELRNKLEIRLGISDLRSNYLVEAQRLNALPRLTLDYMLLSARNIAKLQFSCANTGSSTANAVVIVLRKKTGETLQTNFASIGVGARQTWDSPVMDPNTIRTLFPFSVTITYQNLLGNTFESEFEMPGSGNHTTQTSRVINTYFGPTR
jgi:hypothetical protein